MLVKIWKSICFISLILLTGCGSMYYDYDYREEELSKTKSFAETDAGEQSYEFSKVTPPSSITSDVVSINDTIYDAEFAQMYGYTFMLDKAFVYFALSNDGYFSNVVFTIEEYNQDKKLIDTVTTESLCCLGGYPVKAYFKSSKDVSYLKLIGIDFECNVDNFVDGSMYYFDDKNSDISFKRLSNTTFEYNSKFSGVINLLDENGVQIDYKEIEKGKGSFVTVQEVDSYKIIKK